MLSRPSRSTQSVADLHEPLDPAALHALAVTAQNPWLASLLARRLTTLRERLGELRVWLESLSRQTRRAWTRRWALVLPAAVLAMALASGSVLAKMDATITVDPGGSGCTLSAAITNANNDNQSGSASCAAGSGPDTIDFAAANGTYSYTAALPDIITAITIQGNGNTTIQRTGGPAFSVLRVTGSGSLGLTNATITGGSATNGGGIHAYNSTVSLTSATISGNSAIDNGGGIYAKGSTVNLTSATVSGNSSDDRGGGIYVSDSTVVLTSTTISGNSAAVLGGGIRTHNSTITVTDATISGNTVGFSGGGMFIGGSTANLTNVTISDNTASFGGGISPSYSTVFLTHATISGNSASAGGGIYLTTSALVNSQSSIVAQQAAGADCGLQSYGGTVVSGGYNIESTTSCGFAGTGDQQSVSAAALDLGALGLNAPGTTRTHALGTGSIALNQIPGGTNGCGTTITTDQRGVTRPQPAGGSCDVGAYEFVQAPPAPTAAQITHFAAATDPTGRIRIAWETASEVDVVGFRVERAVDGGPWRAVGSLVPARGSAAGGAAYTSADSPGVGRFTYRLAVVSATGTPQTFGPAEALVRAMRAFLPVAWRAR
jgi:predicted outer membrane repeat protein